jgi:hypothetical protein
MHGEVHRGAQPGLGGDADLDMPLAASAAATVAANTGDRRCHPDGADGLRAALVDDALGESMNSSGAWVKVPD